MNKIEDNALDSTSGYTKDIVSEMTEAAPIPVQNGFDNIREVYVSASGHTRLFSATRYGKRYMLKCLKPDFLIFSIPQFIVRLLQKSLRLVCNLTIPTSAER